MSYDQWKTRSPDDEADLRGSGDEWLEEHERAVERLVRGEDDRRTFIANLIKLGFRGDALVSEILQAESEIAEVFGS